MIMKRNTDSNKYILLGIVIMIMMMFLMMTQQVKMNRKIDSLSKDEILEQVKKGNDDLLELTRLENDILNLKYTLSTYNK